jgi:cellulose synthase/poly-beta-1,6-N-acetylglucosamine synthase-like glycosyltransferase
MVAAPAGGPLDAALAPRRPSNALAYLVLASTALFAVAYVAVLVRALGGVDPSALELAVIAVKTAVEIGASSYGFTFLFSSVLYLAAREPRRVPTVLSERPPVGIVYLCCNDFDAGALESLTTLRYGGRLVLVIHDDSAPAAHATIDAEVERLRAVAGVEILLLRRPVREGGKPGALNYVLAETGDLYESFLLCDNDSTTVDEHAIERAMAYMADPSVAVVQCRSVAIDSASYCTVNRLLAPSVNIFHLFLATYARFGWLPFIGHNAVLRTRAVQEAGGFTPDYFSDDLDLTVRLNLRGHSVAYASEIHFGEKHPPSYDALRRRSYKWAYGCIQVLREHGWAVLTSRRLRLAEKLAFFQFAGFYVGQTVLLGYLALTFLVAPIVLQEYPFDAVMAMIAGTLILFVIFLPSLSYLVKSRRLRGNGRSLLLCGLIYGGTDFSCARGVLDALRRRKRQWIPSNAPTASRNTGALWGEASFGLALLCVPLMTVPAALYMPCSYLFVGKFLFGPAMSVLYDDDKQPPS